MNDFLDIYKLIKERTEGQGPTDDISIALQHRDWAIILDALEIAGQL